MAHIEVHEWKEGRPRPGTMEKHRNSCIDILEVPADGLPNVGDVILITIDPKDYIGTPHRVISREFQWSRISEEDPQAPQKFYKMWIHVRPLTDEEYQADDAGD